jgi:hypothetical protein
MRPLNDPRSLALALILSSGPTALSGAEYLTQEKPTPASVAEINAPLDGLKPDLADDGQSPKLTAPRAASPFWRDTDLHLHLRSYYLERNAYQATDSLAWALGGWLSYRSGLWRDRIALGSTVYTTQKLDGPDNKPGSALLKPVQQGFTVLGEAFADLRLTERTHLRLYRQSLDLPYINRNDIRMVPNTFEAYALSDLTDNRFNYIIAQVTQVKTQATDRFVSMSEAAGAEGSNDGVSLIGFRYQLSPTASAGASNQYGHNTYNTLFTEASASWRIGDALGLRLSAQYTNQQSVGDALLGRFKTDQFGLKSDLDYAGGVLTAAYVETGSGKNIQTPWGGSPSYTSIIIKDFDRADEKAWRLGLSYDFAHVGWHGLSGFANFVSGDTPDTGPVASPDQQELDFTIDYKPSGPLQGLWLRARAAFVDQRGANAQDLSDYRLILNYEVPLL